MSVGINALIPWGWQPRSGQHSRTLGLMFAVGAATSVFACSSDRPSFGETPTQGEATSSPSSSVESQPDAGDVVSNATNEGASASTSASSTNQTSTTRTDAILTSSTSTSGSPTTDGASETTDAYSAETSDGETNTTDGPGDTTDGPSDTTDGDSDTTDGDSDTTDGDSDTTDGETTTNEARQLGVACEENAQCESGFCVDEVCCESACDELCSACNTADEMGQCVGIAVDERCPALSCPGDTECLAYINNDDGENCAMLGQCLTEANCTPDPADVGVSCQSGEGECDGEGECVVPNKAALGEGCSDDESCGSGHCAQTESGDSVCCDTACDGLCQACADDGHCTAAPADDARCPVVDCEASTDCVVYPADVSSDRCVGPGACLTEAAHCVAADEPLGTECTEAERDGTCDGSGTCVPTPVCGDSITEGDEECDDGNDVETDGCTTACNDAACGDGFIQATSGELCDDGNSINGDGCSSDCVGGFAPKGSSMLSSVHLCGIRSNKTIGCWGLNTSGQLGYGSTSSTLETTRTVSGITDAVDVALYGNTTCAVRSGGQVACWGSGFAATPANLTGITDARQISAGDSVFCARRATGAVACWGTDGVVSEPYGYENIVQVAQGNSHGCGLTGDGTIYCVGANAAGEGGRTGALGGTRMTTATAATLLNTGTQLAAGYRYTCYIRTGGASVECVGDSATLGNPSAASGIDPVTVLNVPDPEKLASGGQHVCVLTKAGKVLCWGQGSAAGPDAVNSTPVEVSLPANAIDVGAGSQTSCALLENGETYCWGAYAPTSESQTPVQVTL